MIPISLNVTDEAGLKELNEMNREYLRVLGEVMKSHPSLDIRIHSISRNLSLALQKEFPNKRIGFAVSTGDLTPTDANYYVFPTYMIDDTIFEELINAKRGIYLYVENDGDLSALIKHYDSEQTTALASQIF